MILVILDNHNLGYNAFNKMCAGINENNQEEDERKAPIQIQYMVDLIGVLILIFGLKLSIAPPYYQGGLKEHLGP